MTRKHTIRRPVPRVAALVVQLLAWATLPAGAQPLDPVAAEAELAALAETARARAEQSDFETFRDATLYLPETGKYYVNGDTPIRNEKLLREFWEGSVRRHAASVDDAAPEFAIATVGGLDQIWGTERRALTYCVSDGFGARHGAVAMAMAEATGAWEDAADIAFIHVAAEDGLCEPTNPRILFDVRPVNANGVFLAAAFFPNEPRPARSLVVDPSSFALRGNLTLEGVLRHELGHVLGGRHEHTRPEAGACFEDAEWRGVSDYDAFSVMHYPQCNGRGDWSLTLTASDRSGIACLYGAAAGFAIDPAICAPLGGTTPQSARFGPTDLAAGEIHLIGSFPVEPSTSFSAAMTGAGDPDLYVKIDGPALISNYDCRPYETGALETCDFEVPAQAQFIQVAVHGYAAGSYDITVTHTPRAAP